MEFEFVVKRDDGTYLCFETHDGEYWAEDIKEAWKYRSSVAFNDAEQSNAIPCNSKRKAKVYLVTKTREIEVTREDFELYGNPKKSALEMYRNNDCDE